MNIGDIYFKTWPHLHQYLSVLKLMNTGKWEGNGLFVRKGWGKSKIVIDWIVNSDFQKVLIVCPKISLSVWKYEIRMHSDIDYIIAHGEGKRTAFKYNSRIWVTNYDSVRLLGVNFFKLIRFDAVILDESTCIKSPNTQISNICIDAFNHVPYRILMSGRPSTNSLLDYFQQFKFLDGGMTFGASYWRFRDEWFKQRFDLKWVLDPFKINSFRKKLKPKSIMFHPRFLEIHEGIRFPKAIIRNVMLEMSPSQKKAVSALKDEFAITMGKARYITNWRLAVDAKLRQICGGFIYIDNEVFRFKNPKISALNLVCEDVGKENIVVFINFKEESNIVFQELEKKKKKVFVLKSVMTQSKREELLYEFENSSNSILLANSRMARFSLSLLSCKYAIFYSRSYSVETYDQAKGRIQRLTTRFPNVYIYNFIYRNSIDSVIHKALKENMSQTQYFSSVIKLLSK